MWTSGIPSIVAAVVHLAAGPVALSTLVFDVQMDASGKPVQVLTILDADRSAFAAALDAVAAGRVTALRGTEGRVLTLTPGSADAVEPSPHTLQLSPATAKRVAKMLRTKEEELQVPHVLALEVLPTGYEAGPR